LRKLGLEVMLTEIIPEVTISFSRFITHVDETAARCSAL
jgi:hypothetical protein